MTDVWRWTTVTFEKQYLPSFLWYLDRRFPTFCKHKKNIKFDKTKNCTEQDWANKKPNKNEQINQLILPTAKAGAQFIKVMASMFHTSWHEQMRSKCFPKNREWIKPHIWIWYLINRPRPFKTLFCHLIKFKNNSNRKLRISWEV